MKNLLLMNKGIYSSLLIGQHRPHNIEIIP